MKIKKLFPLFFLFMIIFEGCQQEQPPMEADSAIPVRVEAVSLQSIQEFITATGTIYAIKEALLKTDQAGYYKLQNNSRTGRLFKMGDHVRNGELLIMLENPEYVNQVAIDSKKLNYEASEREYKQQKSIYEKGGITLRELIDAERALIDARYAYENAKLGLAELKIKAPFDGIIVDLPHYTNKQWIESNTDVLEIMDYSRLYAELFLPVKEMDRVNRGQKIIVVNYSSAAEKLDGMVTQISPALDPTSRMFKIKIEVSNKDLLLKPGMFIKAEIVVQEKDSVIVIPKDIILDRRGRKTVFVVQRGIAIERVLKTGIENPDHVEVRGGLNPDDQLIVEGFETLRNRSRVNVLQ